MEARDSNPAATATDRETLSPLHLDSVRLGERDGVGGWPDPELSVGWMMHFELARPRPPLRGYRTMAEALANPSGRLADGPVRTDGMRRYSVGRVIGVVLAGLDGRNGA